MKNYKKLIQCILILAAFIIITLLIQRYFKPFLTIILIFHFSNPIYVFLCNNRIFKNKISAIISIMFVNLFIFLFIILVGNFLFAKINVFMGYDEITQYKNSFNKIWSTFDLDNFIRDVKVIINNLYSNQFVKKSAFHTTEGVIAYFIGNIIVYFILIDKNKIAMYMQKLITENNYIFLKDKINIMNKIIRVELFLVCITTLETIFGFWILNLTHFLLLGILCGILDIIPYIGTIVVFVPLIFYKFYSKKYIVALGLILLFIFLAVSRQIMEAKFMSSKFKIHPLVAIIGFYIGMKFFGIIGMFMAPLYIITVKEIVLS
ncbi:AI-2E family transporter [Haloimpatiens sp. FM7315]|uniref:AI-2E family transporter n=1 Tax=Haloimpatiens sp. FM7315 TaxID=3298609 RepID=UPI00370C58B6